MKQYQLKVYQIVARYEVEIKASSREEALREALRMAKDGKLANVLKDDTEFLATVVADGGGI